MDPNLPHILIAEPEFLVGLDAEFLIKSAINCRTSIVRPEQLDLWDETALANVDLCLFDVPLAATDAMPRIARLSALEVPVLLTAISDPHGRGHGDLDAIPVVLKPYDGLILIALVRQRLRRPAQPLDGPVRTGDRSSHPPSGHSSREPRNRT